VLPSNYGIHNLLTYKRVLTFCTSRVVLKDQPLLWRSFPQERVTLSEGGAVATQTAAGWSLTTTEIEITEGKHYWEVELLSVNILNMFIGISRPNLDPREAYWDRECTDGWFLANTYADNCALFGNGKAGQREAARYKQGDRVGMLLDLDNGSLRFFKNGVKHGPGYPAGSVTGPVVHAVQMWNKQSALRLLPNAEAPIGN
jgi:hypothetical protein